MKRITLILSLLIATLAVNAIPAKRGVWKTIKLADGTEVRAQLVGDEHFHFWNGGDEQNEVCKNQSEGENAVVLDFLLLIPNNTNAKKKSCDDCDERIVKGEVRFVLYDIRSKKIFNAHIQKCFRRNQNHKIKEHIRAENAYHRDDMSRFRL